ncbi:ATP synthase subunit 6 (mitochondrion) [Bidens hawaiensis]|uniref:ATP synthase subunit 6 n=2 Tax=Bidens TaxID=42336 RepID=UPI00300274F7
MSVDEIAERSFNESTLYLPDHLYSPANAEALTKLNYLLVHMKHDFGPQPALIQSFQREVNKTSPEFVYRKLESIHQNQLTSIDNFLKPFNQNFSSKDYLNYCDEYTRSLTITPNSPLEQFDILPLIPMKIGNLYFSFTNSSLFMLLTLSLVLLLIHFVTKKGGGNLVPNAWQSLVELIYDFVLNLVNEQIGGLSGNVKQKFFPCILVTFTFLLFCNLQGMIPYSFTVTSHFLITLGLSFSIFIGITIVGFQRNGLHFLSFLLPAGVPLPLAPFLVLLELISYCFRALSLGIRLFANMMAGHSLVKILSGFAWTMLCMNDILYFIGDLGPLFIVLALTGLELGVAILQAYVFTILICIYLNDAINLH